MRRLLRDPETDPNALDLNGNTPLMASVRSGSLVAVLELLRCADVLPNEPNDRGISPLHYACGSAKVRRLFPSIVRAFADVSPWVNLNARDLVRGESPLIAACRTGYHSAALVLMEDPNVDVWLRDIDGKTALDYADAGLRSQSLASKRFRSRKKAVLGPGSLVAVRNDKDWAIAVSETGHSKGRRLSPRLHRRRDHWRDGVCSPGRHGHLRPGSCHLHRWRQVGNGIPL